MPLNYTLISARFQSLAALFCGFAVMSVLLIYPKTGYSQEAAQAHSAAVIYAYQRIGDDTLPHASLSYEQFTAQIKELQQGDYNVLPLATIIAAFKNDTSLPANTVALTFDAINKTTLERIQPLLDAAGYPYTVFISTDSTDRAEPGSLSWSELRDLSKDKNVELGILPAHYAHMVAQDMAANTASINKSMGRYREELKADPRFFAWPYGEYSRALTKKLAEYGLEAAFGNQSGTAHAKSDLLALPRFQMNDLNGDLDRFRQTARALPLPVSDLAPDDPVLRDNPPMIGFTVSADIKNLDGLSCFVSGQGKVDTRKIGQRIELRPAAPFANRRTRVNCTLPVAVAPGEEPRWRWLGMIFIDPEFNDETIITDTTGFE